MDIELDEAGINLLTRWKVLIEHPVSCIGDKDPPIPTIEEMIDDLIYARTFAMSTLFDYCNVFYAQRTQLCKSDNIASFKIKRTSDPEIIASLEQLKNTLFALNLNYDLEHFKDPD